jgi:hypothetical protein
VFKPLLVVLGFCALVGDANANKPSPAAVDSAEWKAIAAPYVIGNSDEGVLIGSGLGVSYAPTVYMLGSLEYGLKGSFSGTLEGEIVLHRWRHAGKISLDFADRYIYSPHGAVPDPIDTLAIDRFDYKVSTLWRKGVFEVGPSVWVEIVKHDPVHLMPWGPNADRREIVHECGLALSGIRARLRTTSAVRPIDGYIIDAIAQGGFSWQEDRKRSKPDMSLQLQVAQARRITDRLRMYVRGDGRYLETTPWLARNYLGGSKKIRGQPYRRIFARRILMGRAQAHYRFIDSFTLPFRVLHTFMPWIHVWPLEVEAVAFYDAGSAGDPDFGWLRTHHGFGGGIRIVLPPELVVRIDIGFSPGGSPRLYFGIGELL